MVNQKIVTSVLFALISFALAACSKTETPADISKRFWQAVQEGEMDKAKMLSTWDTVEYLKFLNTDKLKPERFELGEQMVGETRAEIETVLFTNKLGQSGIKLPGVTVLTKTESGWRVNVRNSMTSVVKHSTNNVFDQLNGFMQEGIKGLDQTLSEAMNELGSVIEKSAEELKRELEKPLLAPQITPKKPFDAKPDSESSDDSRGQRI